MSHEERKLQQVADRHSAPPTKTITAHEARVISAAAAVDPRTVLRFLRGDRVASTCKARIVAALIERGLEHLVPESSTEVGDG